MNGSTASQGTARPAAPPPLPQVATNWNKDQLGAQTPTSEGLSPKSPPPSPETAAAMNTRRASVGYGSKSGSNSAAHSPTESSKGAHVPSRANEVRPEIKQACENIKNDVPDAKILHYTDQGGMKIPEEAREGVCSAMTAEWIRLGSQHSQADASKAFGSVINGNLDSLSSAQASEMRQGAQIKKKTDAFEADSDRIQSEVQDARTMRGLQKQMNGELRVDQRMRADAGRVAREGQPFRDGADTLSLRKQAMLRDQKNVLTQRVADINQRAPASAAALAHQHAELSSEVDQFRKIRGGGLPGAQVHEFMEVPGGFTDHLKANTAANGFYRIALKSDTGGHVIGLEKTDGACRLMDANTAEWQTKNHQDACELFTSHYRKLYSDQGYTQFDITQYKKP